MNQSNYRGQTLDNNRLSVAPYPVVGRSRIQTNSQMGVGRPEEAYRNEQTAAMHIEMRSSQ